MRTKWQLRRTEGQSLVELALVMPILIILFIGLVEVGYVLRNYMIVVNANREGARLAGRGRWLGSAEDVQEIFRRVIAAGGDIQQEEGWARFLRPLDVADLPANAKFIIHYIEVPSQFDRSGAPDPKDPVIHTWYTGTLSYESKVDVEAIAAAAQQENFEFNQEYFVDRGLLDIPSENNFVIIEIWYQHEQMLKLPVFTEFLPVTFPLYAQTTMRVTLDSRVE